MWMTHLLRSIVWRRSRGQHVVSDNPGTKSGNQGGCVCVGGCVGVGVGVCVGDLGGWVCMCMGEEGLMGRGWLET